MDIGVYSIDEISDKEIDELLSKRKSFTLENIVHMSRSVLVIEKLIENKGLKCRVYTKGRSATVAAAAIPVAPTVIGGWIAAAAIGVHNLATYDPDYEICKNTLGNTLEVNYKK